jgi:hypothetical protein
VNGAVRGTREKRGRKVLIRASKALGVIVDVEGVWGEDSGG